MASARVQLAVRTAERFLQRRGLSRLPVDPFAIAASLDIVVQPKPGTVDGVSGMLLWRGTTFGMWSPRHKVGAWALGRRNMRSRCSVPDRGHRRHHL